MKKLNNKSNYKISEKLSNDGWFNDDTGVYVPYTYKKNKWHDLRNIYLKISRNPVEETKITYTFGKLEDNLFYPMESYTSPELISETDKSLKRQIMYAGKRCSLNEEGGVYVNLVESTKDKINKFDGLSILKEEDYDFSREILTNFTVDPNTIHHNFIDMRELMRLTLKQEPRYKYPKKGFYMFICPFHEGKNPNSRVYKHVFKCYAYTHQQLDQTEFLKLLYGLNNPHEVELKFQSLIS